MLLLISIYIESSDSLITLHMRKLTKFVTLSAASVVSVSEELRHDCLPFLQYDL